MKAAISDWLPTESLYTRPSPGARQPSRSFPTAMPLAGRESGFIENPNAGIFIKRRFGCALGSFFKSWQHDSVDQTVPVLMAHGSALPSTAHSRMRPSSGSAATARTVPWAAIVPLA